ncbi:MAG: hypothetical protein KDM63_21540, partial [Verrucomicrobiae bacterium]|nr:hypothetical protein [Verrucomicrobiae bacterium]
MIAKNWRSLAVVSVGGLTRLITGLGVVLVVPVLQAQTQTSDTAAASGMTTGLPGVSTARQAEMMQ